jgi:CubicO group peptidase (beta-lactamase class C family)
MMRSRRVVLCALAVAIALAPLASAQGLPKASPKSVGLSQDRLDRITAVMQKHVDDGLLAGTVAMVAREGKVAYFQCVGMQDREKQIEMNPQTIFRIASMSKAITSVAVMMLYEEGKFQLKDPVSNFIPEFADTKVLASPGDPSAQDGLVPLKRPITIRNLLTHTSGLTYQWDNRVGAKYAEAGITHGLIQDEDLLADDMKKLAQMPLVHQPGEAFTYGLSVDVLGRVVEVASGMPFDEFLQKRIFEPLLGITAEKLRSQELLAYSHDLAESVDGVNAGRFAYAFLLRATPVQAVASVARHLETMPPKSTFFYPKLITGLTIRSLAQG